MYTVDEKDEVVELRDVPQSSVGAPCPMILVGEHHLHLAFYLQETPQDWDGTEVRIVSEQSAGEPVALVEFIHPYAHIFGPPNDEAFGGHPLASRGLQPYAAFEIRHSSWIRGLERMNSVHEYHSPDLFAQYNHYIFAFHDTTFECVAKEFTVSRRTGSVAKLLQIVMRRIASHQPRI